MLRQYALVDADTVLVAPVRVAIVVAEFGGSRPGVLSERTGRRLSDSGPGRAAPPDAADRVALAPGPDERPDIAADRRPDGRDLTRRL